MDLGNGEQIDDWKVECGNFDDFILGIGCCIVFYIFVLMGCYF